METEALTAPVQPASSRFEPTPATLEALAEEPAPSTVEWYWCPKCKLASLKSAQCPGCGNPYVTVPDAGVLGTPHMPKVPASRSGLAMLGSLLGTLALLAGAALGIFLLASHGASGVDSADATASGSTVDGSSSFSIGTLHGTLRLQGAWGHGMAMMQLPPTITAGGKLKTDLAVGRGSESIVIGSFDSPDPSTVLNNFVLTKPMMSPMPGGGQYTAEPSRDVAVAGFNAVAQDFEIRNAKGGMVSRGTLYAVNADDHVVIIQVSVAPAQSSDLAGIEQALVNIG